jgi:hypothetical protein
LAKAVNYNSALRLLGIAFGFVVVLLSKKVYLKDGNMIESMFRLPMKLFFKISNYMSSCIGTWQMFKFISMANNKWLTSFLVFYKFNSVINHMVKIIS